MRRRRQRLVVSAVTAIAVVVGAGCADEPGIDPDAQPAPNATSFTPGNFDQIPLVTGSNPVAPRSRGGGVAYQDLRVAGWTPERVMSFYAGALPDWDPVGDVVRDANRLRQSWVRADERLEVSAWLVDLASELSLPVVQYRLELRPRGSA